MKIVVYAPEMDLQPWLDGLAGRFPAADIWRWSADCADRQADYALAWSPPAAFLASQRNLKAVFCLGAGVDRLLALHGAAGLGARTPLVRLDDAGMAVQMAEYVCHALFAHTRQFAAYRQQQEQAVWKTLPAIDRAAWPVGVMGLGAIGARVARSVAAFDYPTFGWSRSPKSLAGVTTLHGDEQLDAFLRATRVLVSVLPLTAATTGILNAATLGKLRPDGYLISTGRGGHLVEADLLAMLDGGQLGGATLDVFAAEPLPADHVFWRHPRIQLTPHISAITLVGASLDQIAGKIASMENGQPVAGRVDAERGY